MSRHTMFTDAPEKVIYDYLMDAEHSKKEKERFLDRVKNQKQGFVLLQDTLKLANAKLDKLKPKNVYIKPGMIERRAHPDREKINWIIKTINTELKFASLESRLPGMELSLQSPGKNK